MDSLDKVRKQIKHYEELQHNAHINLEYRQHDIHRLHRAPLFMIEECRYYQDKYDSYTNTLRDLYALDRYIQKQIFEIVSDLLIVDVGEIISEYL